MAEENFHDLGKETDFQIQEAQRVPSKMNRGHIIIQLVKAKERILKAVKENSTSYRQGKPHQLITDFSAVTL